MMLCRGRKAYLNRTFKFYQLKRDRWDRLFGYDKSREGMKKTKLERKWMANKIINYCMEDV